MMLYGTIGRIEIHVPLYFDFYASRCWISDALTRELIPLLLAIAPVQRHFSNIVDRILAFAKK